MFNQADPNQSRLAAVNAASLKPLLQKALKNQAVSVLNWKYENVAGGVGGGRGDTFTYRFSGQADDSGTVRHWSMIVKVLGARQGEQPDDPQYWKREAEIFRHQLLDDLPDGLGAPRSYGVIEYPDESCWVWMEDVHDDLGGEWPLEHYQIVARDLGRFNGAFLTTRAIPDYPWLSSNWFGKTVEGVAGIIPYASQALEKLVKDGIFQRDAVEQLDKLWADRHLFLDVVNTLPQTFCHLDAFRRNLVVCKRSDNQYKTLGLDWAYAGKSALSADLAVCNLVGIFTYEIDVEDALAIQKMTMDGYLNGLGDAGWSGDPEIVRLGYAAETAAKYLELVTTTTIIVDEQMVTWLESFLKHPIHEIRTQMAGMLRYAVAQADEARRLINKRR